MFRNTKWTQSVLAGAVIALCASVSANAQIRPKIVKLNDVPKVVLFVGNSYFYFNNSLHNHVLNLLRSADPAGGYTATSATIGGAPLSLHDVDALLSSHKRHSSSGEDGSNHKQFDAVIMADCNWCSVDPKRKPAFAETVAKDSAIVRKYGAAPVLFMTWAYADKPEMTDKLAAVYTAVGNDNDALVIPAGLAFARARTLRPELALNVPDKSHPSLAGTYLAACVVMASVYRRSPVGNKYHADLDDQTAAFLQDVAWATVQDYYRQ
ncbi:MAG: DUF4886 domain-containing protein [Pseudomonadota bacterium]|nr:hypothetical protein [Afipia sp.]